MRRFIVICLILLFPLQVFADSAEDYPPAYAVSDIQADVSCTSSPLQQLSLCNATLGKLAPAHLDFADILVPAPANALASDLNRLPPESQASFANAIPDRLSKPPPSSPSASSSARILHAVLPMRA